jgi:hypothetical protein
MASRAADLVARPAVRWLAAGGLAVLAAVALLSGRLERRSYIDRQVRGLERVQRLVGPLDQRALVGYRVLPQFDCLVYRRGANLLALELCVDAAGRLVEAADRLGSTQRYYSLRPDPTDSPIRVDRAEVERLLRRMGAKS